MRPRTFTGNAEVLMMLRAFIPLLLLPVMVTPALAQDGEDVVGLPVGARPEPVVIEDLSGDAYDLAEWVGSTPMLLEFWATWCENCAALLPEMEAAYAEFGKRVERSVLVGEAAAFAAGCWQFRLLREST